jgi:hypothetical protein
MEAWGLSWRHVLDCDMSKQSYVSIEGAARAARATGYPYFAWNGEVYLVPKSNSPSPEFYRMPFVHVPGGEAEE